MHKIWKSKTFNTDIKLKLYNTTVLPIALYVSETWKSDNESYSKLNAFHQTCIRTILGIAYKDRITNEEVLIRSKQKSMTTILENHNLKYA